MMRKIREERGMTLVELIAVLALAGMVVAIIMTIFSTGTRYQSMETNNLAMQQEMNLMITRITQIHRSGACYALEQERKGIEVITFSRESGENGDELRDGRCTTSADTSSRYSTGNYEIASCRLVVQDLNTVCEEMTTDMIIDPQRENLRARITLQDSNNKELIQETTFSRFKEEGINEENNTEVSP